MLRRIIRRAVRFAYLLGVNDLVAPAARRRACIDTMGDAYPDLRGQRRLGHRHPRARGGRLPPHPQPRRRRSSRSTFATGATEVPGDVAFKLHDTYGFPVEVTQEMAAERGVEVDLADVRPRSWASSARRAKEAGKKGDVYANRTELPGHPRPSTAPPSSSGREESEAKATVLAVVPADDGTAVDLPRPHALLRRVRRSGRRHRHDHHRHRPGRGARHHLRRSPACTATWPASSRARSRPARRPPRPSTSPGATPSAATTPAPTSCTGRCARSLGDT